MKLKSTRMGVNARKMAHLRQEKRKGVLQSSLSWILRRGMPIVLLISVLGASLWFVSIHIARIDPQSWFALREVQLRGFQGSEREEVLQVIGLELGTPLGKIDLDSVSVRLRKLPWIKSVSAHRRYPSTIVVEVEAASALALLEDAGNWKVVLDNGNIITDPMGPAIPVPIISGGLVPEILMILLELRRSDPVLYASLSQVQWHAEKRAVECVFRHAQHRVLFAANAVDAQTFRHYRMLLRSAQAGLEQVEIIDMRFRGFAYAVRLKKEQQGG